MNICCKENCECFFNIKKPCLEIICYPATACSCCQFGLIPFVVRNCNSFPVRLDRCCIEVVDPCGRKKDDIFPCCPCIKGMCLSPCENSYVLTAQVRTCGKFCPLDKVIVSVWFEPTPCCEQQRLW